MKVFFLLKIRVRPQKGKIVNYVLTSFLTDLVLSPYAKVEIMKNKQRKIYNKQTKKTACGVVRPQT